MHSHNMLLLAAVSSPMVICNDERVMMILKNYEPEGE